MSAHDAATLRIEGDLPAVEMQVWMNGKTMTEWNDPVNDDRAPQETKKGLLYGTRPIHFMARCLYSLASSCFRLSMAVLLRIVQSIVLTRARGTRLVAQRHVFRYSRQPKKGGGGRTLALVRVYYSLV